MEIYACKTNHMVNPMGYAMDKPVVSWKVRDAKGIRTESATVSVSKDADMQNILTELDGDAVCPAGTALPIDLMPSTRYYWKVEVVSDEGERASSEVSWFETPRKEHDWEADWITPGFAEDGVVCSIFEVKKPVEKARISISGLGLYELYINGKKVGNEYLTPNFNDYDSWIQFQTYDIKESLSVGSHQVEIVLGSGWYKGRYLTFNEGSIPDRKYGDLTAAIAEITIDYIDGSREIINTDESWYSRKSRIRSNNIYDGETIDDTFDISERFAVRKAGIEKYKLHARLSLPVRKMATLSPKELIKTTRGEMVLDFGQNLAGWFVFHNRLPEGRKCRLVGGEILQDGCFYHGNMRTARTEFCYTSDGKEKLVRPHFTYYGFRYVLLEGFDDDVLLDDFEAWVLYSDMEQTGFIRTGHDKVNRLLSNILWGQRSNFIDVPTDCPQRDERLGWTGDTQVFCRTASYNMDTQEFYRKHMTDVRHEQGKNAGMVPMVVPDLFLTATSAAWGDVATIVPWVQYEMYGDKELLAGQYPGMKSWVDYIRSQDEQDGGSRLWKCGTHFGDWLSLDTPDGRATGGTDEHFIASCFYYYSSLLTAKAANVLDYVDDAKEYGWLSVEIAKAIHREYFTASGRLSVDTQTALTLVLQFNLCPGEESRRLAVTRLVDKIRQNGNHLDTGFVGTPYLCPVLSTSGYHELAVTLLLNEDFPGWLYAVNMGATTVWERWNSVREDGTMHPDGMNSLNHYAYGSVEEWIYQYVLGIGQEQGGAAWKKILLTPMPDDRIGEAQAVFESPYGRITSKWGYSDDGIHYEFNIPFDCTAKITLPDGTEKEVGAGHYEYDTKKTEAKRRSIGDIPLSELMENKEKYDILQKEIPDIVEHADQFYSGQTLRQSIGSVFNRYTYLDLGRLEELLT